MPVLLPCPFCGHDLNVQDYDHDTVYPAAPGVWSINCAEEHGGCSAQILASTPAQCVDKWNRRHGHQ